MIVLKRRVVRCTNCKSLETGIIVIWATKHDECLSNPPNCFEETACLVG
jgi:hypothetical protein